MMRLRALAALFACLAILASGVMAVAAAMPGASTAERTAATPCSHCDECDGVPCPIPMPACTQVGASAVPTLATASADMPALGSSLIHWSLLTTSLSGLSPPPDPFPPRT